MLSRVRTTATAILPLLRPARRPPCNNAPNHREHTRRQQQVNPTRCFGRKRDASPHHQHDQTGNDVAIHVGIREEERGEQLRWMLHRE